MAALSLLIVVGGCQTHWAKRKQLEGFALPARITLILNVSERVKANDEGGFVDTLALVVQEDLREKGVYAEIVHADSEPVKKGRLPRVELVITDFEPGFAPSFATLGMQRLTKVYVDCAVVSAKNEIVFSGKLRDEGMDFVSNPRAGAESAGHAIADAISKYN